MKNKLSKAVLPINFLTGAIIKAQCEIQIMGLWNSNNPIKHHTGYYLFLNQPIGNYTILLKSKGFIDQQESITVEEFPTYSLPITDVLLTQVSHP